MLERCEQLNVTISKKKFEIAEELVFAGYVFGAEGIKPDPEKVECIQNFPQPTSATDIRSFLGMANQLAFFLPDYSHMSVQMRKLTGKGVQWQWLPEHEDEFRKLKNVLAGKLVVQPYDPDVPITILTDASRLFGLGFAMVQYVNGKTKIVTCGSCSLTETQRRYATVELECLAIKYAILKCSYYLKGHPGFQVITDHRPLEGIFKKEIFEVENMRLQRIREKLAAYSFKVTWVKGKNHLIADALSRAPYFEASEENELYCHAIFSLKVSGDQALVWLQECRDEEYSRIREAILNDYGYKNLQLGGQNVERNLA